MNINKVLILEGEKSNLNEFNNLKEIYLFKINSVLILKIVIFILFIIIFVLFLIIKKNNNYNYIIELSQNNTFLNNKIKQFDFIEVKLQILE
jgi:hypothetical protein